MKRASRKTVRKAQKFYFEQAGGCKKGAYKVAKESWEARHPSYSQIVSHVTSVTKRYPDAITGDGSENQEKLREWFNEAKKIPCKFCGEKHPNHIDHILPLSRGGKHSWDNLQVLCKTCNIAKNAQTEEEFNEWINRLIAMRT